MSNDRDPLDESWFLPVPKKDASRKASILGFFRSRFVTGALVAFPLVVSIFFAKFMFTLLDSWSYPVSKQLFGREVPGVGAALALVLIFLLGLLGHNVLGRRVLKIGEAILGRVPLLRPIYVGAREVTRAFGHDRTKGFRRVVLIPFPLDDVWSIGFLTNEFEVTSDAGPTRMLAVFMPTTPNPTTGYYMLLPPEKVRDTSLGVEEAIRMVISGGLVSPDPRRLAPPTAPTPEVTP